MDRAPRGEAEWKRKVERRLTWLERRAGGGRSVSEPIEAEVASGLTGSVTAHRNGRLVGLEGILSGSAPAAFPTAVLQLPEGYWPASSLKCTVGGSASTNTAIRLVSVTDTGLVQVLSWDTGTSLWLNGVHYVSAP